MEQYILNENSEFVLIKDEDKAPQWTSHLTNLLIDFRLQQNDEFKRYKSKKFELWEKIAEKMHKSTDEAHFITGPLCDNKWRNLLTTFRKIKLSNKKRCYWEYYEQLETAFKNKIISDDILKAKTKTLNLSTKIEKLQTQTNTPPEWFLNALEKDRNDYQMADNDLKERFDRLEKLENEKVKAVEELNNLLKVLITKQRIDTNVNNN